MNKNAIILHGTGDNPDSFWYPYAKKKLEEKGYNVWVPQLPNAEKPELKHQLPFILENGNFGEETVLIGHSAGVPLALSILENLDTKIKQALLVAGFVEPLNDADDGPNLILQKKYDWKKISSNVNDIIFIHSNNDPWGCDDKQGRKMFDNIGGTLIIRHGEGHMGSNVYNQPYKEFPFLATLIS